MKKIIALLVVLTLLVGCESSISTNAVDNSKNRQITSSNILNTNGEIKTIFIETPKPSGDDSVDNYSKPIEEWISKNRDKKILNLTNMPDQGGIIGVFITFSKPDNFKNNYKVYIEEPNMLDGGEFGKEEYYRQNMVRGGEKYLSVNNLVTATTVNYWRGGIEYIIVICE